MVNRFPVEASFSMREDPQKSLSDNIHSSKPGARNHHKKVEPMLEDDVPPDGGYGWVVVACAFWINAHTWGINSSFGVFLSYYLSNGVFLNTNPLSYAFTGGLSVSTALFIAPLATWLICRYGTRFVLNVGVLFETLSFIGSSFATQQWHIFLSQGACFGIGMGCLFVGTAGVTSQWFLRRRSLANGVVAAGSGIGGLTYSLAVGSMIPNIGLPWTFRVLAIVSFVVNLTACNLLRDRNKAIGSRYQAFPLSLLKRPEYICYLGWGVFTMLGYIAVLFSLANFSLSVGLSANQGNIVSALLNLGQALGRPFVGMASDRFGRINIASFLSFLTALFCLVVWTVARSMSVVCFFAVIVGTGAGTYWATVVPVLAEIIGVRDLPSGLSLTWIILVAPCTVAEAIALELRNSSKSDREYLPVEIFTGFMYIGASVCLWIVRGWRIGELELLGDETTSINVVQTRLPAIDSSEQQLGDSGQASKKEGDMNITPEQRIMNERSQSKSTDPKLWNPLSLARRMVILKKV